MTHIWPKKSATTGNGPYMATMNNFANFQRICMKLDTPTFFVDDKFRIKILKFKMADFFWKRPWIRNERFKRYYTSLEYILKMRACVREITKFECLELIRYLRPKNVPSVIYFYNGILKLITINRHIGSASLNFAILSINSS